jgi:shikimate dehydrogenase
VRQPTGEMDQEMNLFGLIGFPLGHSWSAIYFNKKFSLEGDSGKEYRLFPLRSIEEFPKLLSDYPELTGLNVTIPYKEIIIPYLDELDEIARSVGAVNTIKIIRKNGKIMTKGFNTDSPGFLLTLGEQVPKGPALILGTGGGAKAVAHALKMKNIRFQFVSRKPEGPCTISYKDLTFDLVNDHLLIINATPSGMYPDVDKFPPIPYQYLSEKHYLYDLVYNPEETEFIKKGKAMKTQTLNGRQMLINQAEFSYKIFIDSE